jgi:hypothetical protein
MAQKSGKVEIQVYFGYCYPCIIDSLHHYFDTKRKVKITYCTKSKIAYYVFESKIEKELNRKLNIKLCNKDNCDEKFGTLFLYK